MELEVGQYWLIYNSWLIRIDEIQRTQTPVNIATCTSLTVYAGELVSFYDSDLKQHGHFIHDFEVDNLRELIRVILVQEMLTNG